MTPGGGWETLLQDVVARIGRLSLASAAAPGESGVTLGPRKAPSQVLTMLEPTQLASYSGSRTAVPWTTAQTGHPRADMAYVAIRCRDYGSTAHSASFLVRPDPAGYARTVTSFAFPSGNYVDKEATVFLFVELDSQGAFQYSVTGGFQEWDITLHGLLETN